MVIDSEVVLRKLLSLADVFGAQTFYVYELSEVVVVGEHKNFILRAF